MHQSSLSAWLSKPSSVQAPAPATLPLRTASAPVKADLPTPPLSDDEQHNAPLQPLPALVAPSFTSKTRPLPPNVELRRCTKDDIPTLKRLNGLLLPIPYPDKFYREIIEDAVTSNITLLATWQDSPSSKSPSKGRVVGAIRCRLLAHPPQQHLPPGRKDGPMLYLSTLVLLSPYRQHGIATHLLQTMLARAVRDYGVTSVGAHVWEANEEGLLWYRKRGFREVGREAGYYRRLKSQGAVVVQREVGVMDLVGD